MELSGKKVLLVGLAKTGVATIKSLAKHGAEITVNDIKSEDKLADILDEIKNIEGIKYIFGKHPEDISDIDMVVVSPGVPLDMPFTEKIKSEGIYMIGEVELAYQLADEPYFVGITGTNGKTTTTSLTGEIFEKAGKETYIVGNIGNPVIEAVDNSNKNACFITELSSFQLESIDKFCPKVSAVLNITEDHMNRHHTMENYIDAKARVFMNQTEDDFCILNYDDEITRNLSSKCKAKVVFFSRKEKISGGVYTEDGNIVIDIDKKITLMPAYKYVSDCESPFICGNPPLVATHLKQDKFEILWPDRNIFPVGAREIFTKREEELMYFNRWHEAGNKYYKETVIRHYPDGQLVEIILEETREPEIYTKWILCDNLWEINKYEK